MHPAPRALIAGLGLIGGSIGMALRKRGWSVAFIDPNVTLDDARHAEAADEKVETIGASDVIVLATPVDVAIEMLSTQDSGNRTTSVCGVMQPLRSAAADRNFIAGHPLAGSHERGLRAARADLFRMISDCEARAEVVTAVEHDAAIALTSHLPQILSTALAAVLEERDIDERFAGSGLRTFLRLAGSDASVWSPLLEANRSNIDEHADAVCRMVKSIVAGDPAAFGRAQRLWKRLLSSARE